MKEIKKAKFRFTSFEILTIIVASIFALGFIVEYQVKSTVDIKGILFPVLMFGVAILYSAIVMFGNSLMIRKHLKKLRKDKKNVKTMMSFSFRSYLNEFGIDCIIIISNMKLLFMMNAYDAKEPLKTLAMFAIALLITFSIYRIGKYTTKYLGKNTIETAEIINDVLNMWDEEKALQGVQKQ